MFLREQDRDISRLLIAHWNLTGTPYAAVPPYNHMDLCEKSLLATSGPVAAQRFYACAELV